MTRLAASTALCWKYASIATRISTLRPSQVDLVSATRWACQGIRGTLNKCCLPDPAALTERAQGVAHKRQGIPAPRPAIRQPKALPGCGLPGRRWYELIVPAANRAADIAAKQTTFSRHMAERPQLEHASRADDSRDVALRCEQSELMIMRQPYSIVMQHVGCAEFGQRLCGLAGHETDLATSGEERRTRYRLICACVPASAKATASRATE